MKQNVRSKTALVVSRGGEFLVGFSVFLRWSTSAYDAWHTRDIESAKRVAEKVSGQLMLFNPIVGQIKDFKG